MAHQLDHLVILVPSLETAIPDAIAAGFAVVHGGQHATGGTENALIAFANGSYIELIAFIDPATPSTNPWYARLALGGGLVDYALLTGDVATDVARIRAQDVEFDDASSMGRRRTDGQRIEWTLSMAGHDGLPFLIQDQTPRSLRVPHAPDETSHLNGATGISGVTVLVADLDVASTAFTTVVGAGPITIEPPQAGLARAFLYSVGPGSRQWICVAEPEPHAEDDPAESAIPARYLARYGPGPFTFTLSTAAGAEPAPPGAGTLLDPGRLGNARCYLA